MRKEISEQEIIGKTIDGFRISSLGDMMLTFTDESYIRFGVEVDIYEGWGDIVISRDSLLSFGDDSLLALGVVSEEELRLLRAELEEKDRKRREELI